MMEQPFCSVLNVVVDHIMEPPGPLEPEEFIESKLPQHEKPSGNLDNDFSESMLPSINGTSKPVDGGLLVPVLRIFGPVIRGGCPFPPPSPQQSCCLYIHGAYPYLLARPIEAGPDGSLIRRPAQRGHVDWDSVESVERIVPHLAKTLESTIQALNFFGGGNSNKKGKQAPTSVRQPEARVIRRVTVVQGRGFYTYCPGPPAPFIRVEYYNPKLRWKVKLALERGLDLPFMYHPDTRQYDYASEDDDDERRRESTLNSMPGVVVGPKDENLKFHCYEAHIPYTMQFFKDQNIAGMSYIHLVRGRIRGWPKAPWKWLSHTSNGRRSEDENEEYRDDSLFLRSNVPFEHMWPRTVERQCDDKSKNATLDSFLQQSSSNSQGSAHISTSQLRAVVRGAEDNSPARHLNIPCNENPTDQATTLLQSAGVAPPGKGTSCDVEIDCCVEDILNIQSVIHSLPSDQDERDKIQWRAVPSLQEVWRQERRRMNKLLSPQDNFLSHTPVEMVGSSPDNDEKSDMNGCGSSPSNTRKLSTPPFTLDVKKSASRPGARLASKGMWSLVNVSQGLQEEFIRALSQIVKRHDQKIKEMDTNLLLGRSLHNVGGSFDGVNNTQDCDNASNALQTQSSDEEHQKGQLHQLTPTMDEAIEKLSSLGCQFTNSNFPSSACSQSDDGSSKLDDEASNWLLDHSSPTPHQARSERMDFVPAHQTYDSDSSIENSEDLVYTTSQDVDDGIAGASSSLDPAEYSQRLERGDSVFIRDHFCAEDLEDYINPETLLPFEHLYFDEDRCLVRFVVETDDCGTIRICGANAQHCTRRGHSKSSDRAAPGNYKTITNGNLVDGIISPQSSSLHADLDGNEEQGGRNFEHELSMLATQIPLTHSDQPPPPPHQSQVDVDFGNEFENNEVPLHQQISGVDASNESLRNGNDEDARSCDSSDDGRNSDDTNSVEACSVDESLKRFENVGFTDDSNHQPWSCPGDSVAPKATPPYTSEIARIDAYTPLCRLETTRSVPSWLTHSSKYSEVRKDQIRRDEKPARTSRLCHERKIYIQPVRLPPSSSEVAAWHKRNVDQATEGEPVRSFKKRARTGTLSVAHNNVIEIDGNSRMFVTNAAKKLRLQDGEEPLLEAQCIEEFQWESSQPMQLSASQLSPPDNPSASQSHSEAEVEINNSRARDSNSVSQDESQNSGHALDGIGNQGGRIHVQGGGGLKAKTKASQPSALSASGSEIGEQCFRYVDFLPSPITIMTIEIHVQCRTGSSRLDGKKISMSPDSSKDKVTAVTYVFGKDPGGGEPLKFTERGCIYVPLETESGDRDSQVSSIRSSIPRSIMGTSAEILVECVKDENRLLHRLKDIVRIRDPDMLLSWDTQGSGLGYLIERGLQVGKARQDEATTKGIANDRLDMARLLGRTPNDSQRSSFTMNSPLVKDARIDEETQISNAPMPQAAETWKGSGLGSDWDERVGAGAAAASIVGRLVFSGWKIISEEVKHANASYLPAVVASVLNKRIPHHSDLTLSHWYANSKGRDRWKVLHHRLVQATATLLLFDALDIIGRAGEAARLSGVEFSQSFPGIRGSQYKVEGVLLRALQSLRSDERGSKKGLIKPNPGASSSVGFSDESKSQTQSPWKLRRGNFYNEESSSETNEDRQYFFYSPSLEDTNKQEALEVQALTLEPISGHYNDPVVVCDFTALYPSLMIAYNLCYSTCAGKLEYHSTRREMRVEGRTTGRLGPFHYSEARTATVLSHHMKSLQPNGNVSGIFKDRAYIAPTGTIYVSEDVVKGVLPQVLDEILTTRAMLKKAAKEYKEKVPNLSPAILRQLEARQLALKYVANVTYGYTSATFSGRCAMPLLADTIVACGRQTLRKAIELVTRWGKESTKWRDCEVIYGDTDSLFVKLPGRSCKEAFEFGEALCCAVTADNPPPVQLKLEKVYVGSIMQTMKRYCGMKLESKHQKRPAFEAKGLETVRRDQCALTQKVLRNALIALFRNGPEAVKEYLYRQWSLIFSGNLPVQDFILTGRVRSRYRGGREGPVQAVLARRLAEADPGRVVRHKERLPYVIVATPGVTFRLKDCVLTPLELLERWDSYTIHSTYYITKHVNASLQRCLGLAPHYIDVNSWFQSCPKPRRRINFWPVCSRSRAMITSYFGSDICSLCHAKCKAQGRSRAVVCDRCKEDRVKATYVATRQLNDVQRAAHAIAKKCSRCNLCFEDASTFAEICHDKCHTRAPRNQLRGISQHTATSLVVPIANCVCIDCPVTFQRHRLREKEIEAKAVCSALDLF